MSRLVISLCVMLSAVRVSADPPKVLDDRLKLELFAEQPQIVTPMGIDVDHLGRVWAIESNTHFPPDGYQGPPTDRVLILEDTDADGRADQVTPFADGLTHAMSVVVKPVWLDLPASGGRQPPDSTPRQDAKTGGLRPPLAVFMATRKEILRLRDTNNDLRADERTTLVRLDTPGNYPHNGLAGIAFDALGWMFFGFGENLGADYKIIGSDGVTLSGGGEGGNMYRCRPDGTKLERWATGFWNPHASCFDAFGRLFTVDNDPDSRPPCRLLHIIPGGDYGYRFRNGRRGTHPFTSWNGEIPGTLPMVSGTGEAPSGILCYESDGFPDDYLGTLLVGTWGDHRIDQFVLEPKGASFTSRPKPIVQGDETFRPVGLALAPDGSVFFTDWVLKDYKLHGKGRVWRLSGKVAPQSKQADLLETVETATLPDLDKLAASTSVASRRLASRTMLKSGAGRVLLATSLVDRRNSDRQRIEALWAIANRPYAFRMKPSTNDDAPIGFAFDDVATAFLGCATSPDFNWNVAVQAWEKGNPKTWFRANQQQVSRETFSRFVLASNFIPRQSYDVLQGDYQRHGNAIPKFSDIDIDLPDAFETSAHVTAIERAQGSADFRDATGLQLYFSDTPLGMALQTEFCAT
ncbi:MAG TPA: PVC-type heme-binding CxxCH protein, partial [Planctomycetaceae bacterium]|nr:PVC-type heme-binding CxxCH protein [Planctomycetaceae bacterium]